ncbi:MAG: hypothetical protein HYZ17_10615 [Betaproteobacteria bacterium]|nr:hypothetical protein [Betaproteobacteria bacterium]
MAYHRRIITKGDILRSNIFSVLVILFLASAFGGWVYINRMWTEQAQVATARTIATATTPQGPGAVIEWQAGEKTYQRVAFGAPTTVGDTTEVHFLAEAPERALTATEWQDEPARLLALPMLAVFVLICLFKLWMIYWGPRRADDRKVVAEVLERD